MMRTQEIFVKRVKKKPKQKPQTRDYLSLFSIIMPSVAFPFDSQKHVEREDWLSQDTKTNDDGPTKQ